MRVYKRFNNENRYFHSLFGASVRGIEGLIPLDSQTVKEEERRGHLPLFCPLQDSEQ